MKVCIKVDWGRQQICLTEPPSITGRLKFVLGSNSFQGEKMALTLTDVQSVAATISYVDAKGNPAVVDGAPVWASSDPTGLTVTPSEDGFSASIVAVGPLGTFQVTVTADADLGAGVTPVITIADITVVASAAVAGTLSFGTPA